MNEKHFLIPLLVFMGLGLLAVVVVPAAHVGVLGFAIGKDLAFDILAILIYLLLRRRYRLPFLSQRGLVRRFFWLLLSIPTILLTGAVSGDIYNRRLPAFADAIRVAHQSEVVRTEVGTSLRVGWPMESDSAKLGNEERRLLRVAIAGEKGQAYLRIVGTKTDGAWRLKKLSLFPQNGDHREIVLFGTSK